tara:strand:- start:134 stop:679 length:546 start_codon:yes stop_codon:yes gene_type:complete
MIKSLKHILAITTLFLACASNSYAAGSYSDSSESSSSSSSSSNYSDGGSNDKYDTIGQPLTKAQKYIKLITVPLGKNDYESSYELAKKATELYPNNPDAWNYLGFSSRKLGKYDESEKAYTEALSINPKHVGAMEYYGELHLTLKRPEKAKLLLAKLKSLCSFNCKEMKQLEKAIKNYENN